MPETMHEPRFGTGATGGLLKLHAYWEACNTHRVAKVPTMEADFWLQKWKKNEIGFHETQANTHLVENWHKLALPQGGRVFVPLCGKTRDIAWLLARGYRVAGAELSELAVEQLFAELEIKPVLRRRDKLAHWSAGGIDIFVGDIFDVSAEMLGPVEAIYDRAALAAMPEDVRGRYVTHLMQITKRAPQFLVCFEYDQRLQNGPPFSVGPAKVEQYYATSYGLRRIATVDVPGGLKGKCPASESVWLLQTL